MTENQFDCGQIGVHYQIDTTKTLRQALEAAFDENEEGLQGVLDMFSSFMAAQLVDGLISTGEKGRAIHGESLIITLKFEHTEIPERAEELRKKFQDLNRDTPEGEKEKTFFDVA